MKLGETNRPFARFFVIALWNGADLTDLGSKFYLVPLDVMWAKAIGLWGELVDKRALAMSTWNKGITFSTKRRPDSGLPSSEHASGALEFNASVPIWDCREAVPSNLNFAAHNLNRIEATDVPYQSAVLATFTVCRVTNEKSFKETVPQSVVFYIHELALLASGRGAGSDHSVPLGSPHDVNLGMGGYPTLDELDTSAHEDLPDYIVKFDEGDEPVSFV